MNKIATAFFGSSIHSLPYLEFLLVNPLVELRLLVSQPDKPAGRGFEQRATATKLWAQKHGLLTLTPPNLTDPLFLGVIKTLPLKLGLAVYYGLKIPKEIIERFPLGILNVHHSLLPDHRGANPIPWAILGGDAETGTTFIKINENFDQGGIVAQRAEKILETDTGESLRRRLDEKALTLLEKVLPEYLDGRIDLKKQDATAGSYEPKITKETAKIDWREPADLIERKIRAFYPWPVAWTMLGQLLNKLKVKSEKSKVNDKRVKIMKAHLNEEKKLLIDELQIEGKKPIGWKEFLAGYAGRFV